MTTDRAPIFVALDTVDVTLASDLASAVTPFVTGVKLGLEFFLTCGHPGYHRVQDSGAPIFLDLKLHDIPNTVAGGIRSVAPLRPQYLTVHTQGGPAMMRSAVDTAADTTPDTRILGVTILTSLDDRDLAQMGVQGQVTDQVRRLAELAVTSGLTGLVCSASDVAVLRSDLGPDISLVVPGIRPAGSAVGDQKRVMTPEAALAAGATDLVIGRPITQARDPAAAAETIAASL